MTRNDYNKIIPNSSRCGIVQWFYINQFREVEQSLKDFEKLGISHIRTNISWADWHRPGGKKWYDWLFSMIGNKLEILPCISYTPPSIALQYKSSAPPRNPKDYADFIDTIITEYGKYFEYIELWNEPNNLTEYDFTLDPHWHIFCDMIGSAAYWSRQRGKKTVLGGMSPIDPHWLNIMFRKRLMQYIDVVGIHGFPDVFDYNWNGWEEEISKIQGVLHKHKSPAELWITETGFSTWQKNERKQVQHFLNAVSAGAGRVYWYSLKDLSQNFPATDRFHLDEREYYFGIKNENDSPKLLYTLLASHGIDKIDEYQWITEPVIGKKSKEKYTLITGGAGFVGTNLANRLLSEGRPVLILDNLSRAGVENNLFWLKEKYPDNLQIMITDIRDKLAVREAVSHAEHIFHFAAQVAVTSSLIDPFHDFEVNAQGTLNLLEAIRNTDHQPSVIFTSTNKVYGDLNDMGLVMNCTRYHPEHTAYRKKGINEERNLEFHSPYGCTKGIADQYILDYARTFGIKSIVFRMSCIYGPHQFGTEDQGWVAHFLIRALHNKTITLYGDGKQVRDILFVGDLINAFMLARQNMNLIAGNAFNIGGGINNTVSLLELLDIIGLVSGKKPRFKTEDWRPSDQKYYVTDYTKFYKATQWKPEVNVRQGVERLYQWLKENPVVPVKRRQRTVKKIASAA